MCTVRGGQNAFSMALRSLEAISAFEGINTARREVLVVNCSTNSKFLSVMCHVFLPFVSIFGLFPVLV